VESILLEKGIFQIERLYDNNLVFINEFCGYEGNQAATALIRSIKSCGISRREV
jgi:hypothetical protein